MYAITWWMCARALGLISTAVYQRSSGRFTGIRMYLIFDRPGGRNLEVLGHRVDRVGLADGPAVGQRRHLRHIGHVALGRAAVNPRDDGLDFLVRQTRIVAEHAVRHVRPPRRHRPLRDALLDRAQPRTRVFERRQRHRREHRRAMALDARLVEDRRDVLGEGRCAVGCHRRHCRDHPRDEDTQKRARNAWDAPPCTLPLD